MFGRALSAFGVGGPTVDTVLASPHTLPGQVIVGSVDIRGGSTDVEIDEVVLSVVASVEAEYGDRELLKVVAQQEVHVPSRQLVSIPFQLLAPWETPITAIGGGQLPEVSVGVRTEFVVFGAPDKGDPHLLQVEPTPWQASVLDAFGQLGFRIRAAGVDTGHLPGIPHELSFYQEFRFLPPAQHAGDITEVELTFVAGPAGVVRGARSTPPRRRIPAGRRLAWTSPDDATISDDDRLAVPDR